MIETTASPRQYIRKASDSPPLNLYFIEEKCPHTSSRKSRSKNHSLSRSGLAQKHGPKARRQHTDTELKSHKARPNITWVADYTSESLREGAPSVRELEDDDSSTAPPKQLEPQLVFASLPLNGIREDPFRSLPIPAEGCVPMTIDYYLQQWAPEYDVDYSLAGYGRPHSFVVFPLAMNNTVLLESLVAMCRVFWLMARGRKWKADAEYLKHRGMALELVRACLRGKSYTDDATLLAIVCLTSIELLAQNFPAVVQHARGLNTLLEARRDDGDDSTTSHYAKCSAKAHGMLGEYIRARRCEATQNAKPSPKPQKLSQPLSYPTHPFGTKVCNVLANLPSGFCELAMGGALSNQCIWILSSLSKKIEKHTQSTMLAASMNEDIQQELKALQHFYTLSKTSTEDYLTSGLICFCNQYPDRTSRNPFFSIALKCFNSALNAREKIIGIWREECLVWVAVVTAGALDICAEPLSDRHIVLDSCLEECERARHWGTLEAILRSFFWTDALGQHWKQCWEAAMSRRWQKQRRGDGLDSCSSPHGSETSTSSSTITSSLPAPSDADQLHSKGLGKLLHETQNLTKAFIQAQQI